MSTSLKDRQRQCRLLKFQISRGSTAITNLIAKQASPEIVVLIEEELVDMKVNLDEFKDLHKDIQSYYTYTAKEGEDEKTIQANQAKLDEKWVNEMREPATTFKDAYVKGKAYIEKYNGTQSRGSLLSSSFAHSTSIGWSPTALLEPNLKPLQVPKFNGDPKTCVDFSELFENLIHNNSELTNVQKMHRLKEALVGEAADCIRSFKLQDSAYQEAWHGWRNGMRTSVE